MAMVTPVIDLETYRRIASGQMTVEQAIDAQPYPTPLLSQAAGQSPTQRKKRDNPEEREQIAFIEWCNTNADYPELARFHHSPNGGKRNSFEAHRFKLAGVRPGFPDLVLLYPSGKYHGLAIEMKAPEGEATDDQDGWIEYLTSVGYCALVCWGAEEAKEAATLYMEGQL